MNTSTAMIVVAHGTKMPLMLATMKKLFCTDAMDAPRTAPTTPRMRTTEGERLAPTTPVTTANVVTDPSMPP